MAVLTGLSAFPITPSNAGGHVDVVALRKLVARLCAADVDSIGLLGSTGSYPYLSRAERRRALDAALEETSGRLPILVGVGALRTDEAVRLAQDAKAAGAAAGLLAPVSYTPLNEEEVFEHFAAVARESGLPLCIYDNPGTTHFRFSPALVGRLSRMAGIVAVKSPAPKASTVAAHLADLRDLVPEGFSLGYSGDWNAVEALLAGGDAWYSVIAGLFPGISVAMVRAVQKRRRRHSAAPQRQPGAALGIIQGILQLARHLRVRRSAGHLPRRAVSPDPAAFRSAPAACGGHARSVGPELMRTEITQADPPGQQ